MSTLSRGEEVALRKETCSFNCLHDVACMRSSGSCASTLTSNHSIARPRRHDGVVTAELLRVCMHALFVQYWLAVGSRCRRPCLAYVCLRRTGARGRLVEDLCLLLKMWAPTTRLLPGEQKGVWKEGGGGWPSHCHLSCEPEQVLCRRT